MISGACRCRTGGEIWDWETFSDKREAELESFYSQLLRSLSTEKGMLGQIFTKSQNKIQDPSRLLRVIDLIDKKNWNMMGADIKGKIYEGLLEKNAMDSSGSSDETNEDGRWRKYSYEEILVREKDQPRHLLAQGSKLDRSGQFARSRCAGQ